MAAALEADHPDQALQLLRGMAQKLGKGQFNSICIHLYITWFFVSEIFERTDWIQNNN